MLKNILEITDADIEAWVSKYPFFTGRKLFNEGLEAGLITGAKAVLNGEIKYIE